MCSGEAQGADVGFSLPAVLPRLAFHLVLAVGAEHECDSALSSCSVHPGNTQGTPRACSQLLCCSITSKQPQNHLCPVGLGQTWAALLWMALGRVWAAEHFLQIPCTSTARFVLKGSHCSFLAASHSFLPKIVDIQYSATCPHASFVLQSTPPISTRMFITESQNHRIS